MFIYDHDHGADAGAAIGATGAPPGPAAGTAGPGAGIGPVPGAPNEGGIAPRGKSASDGSTTAGGGGGGGIATTGGKGIVGCRRINGPKNGKSGFVDGSIYHEPLEGRQTERSVLPSPS